jgi:cytochrome c2
MYPFVYFGSIIIFACSVLFIKASRKVFTMINTDLRNQLLLYLFVFGTVFSLQAQTADQGKELFNAKGCAACHAKDMMTDLTGPALAGVRDRWENQDELYRWVRESSKMIEEGHEYGTALFEKFNKVPMLPYLI